MAGASRRSTSAARGVIAVLRVSCDQPSLEVTAARGPSHWQSVGLPLDDRKCRPGDQDSDEVLKEIPGQKRTSRSTRGESSRPELPLQSQNSTFKLNNQVFSRIAGRGPTAGHSRRCGNVDTLLPRERQSIQASPAFGVTACQPRHPATPHPGSHLRDSRSEPGFPRLERTRVASVVHEAGAHAAMGGETRAGERRRPSAPRVSSRSGDTIPDRPSRLSR